MLHYRAMPPAPVAAAVLGALLSTASFAQSVFLFHDEKLKNANASEHVIAHDMGATYSNQRLRIDRSAKSNRQTPALWDVASAGGVLGGLNPKILLNASGTSDSQPESRPKLGLAVALQANAISDRNSLLPDDRVNGKTKSVSELRKGWVIKEYVAYPNQPTKLEGVDVTFALRIASQSAMGTLLKAGVWISKEGESSASILMDVECNYLMCKFTFYNAQGMPVRQDVQSGPHIIYKAFFPDYKPGKTFWWMCNSGGQPTKNLETQTCRAEAIVEESLSPTKTKGPWQKQGKLDYTVEVDMTRSSHGTWW